LGPADLIIFGCRQAEAVIKFKCIYCGHKILAQEDGRGKKGRCPKCRHELRVPLTTEGRPAVSADTPDKLQHAAEAIAILQSDDVTELSRESAGWFIPTYDESSLFLMAMTLILLYVGNSQMRGQINYFLTHVRDLSIFLLVVFLLLAGLVLCLYHVFTRREKTRPEKVVMMLFAVLTNAGTGIISGWYVIKNTIAPNWLLVFPIWNMINGVFMLLMLRLKVIDEECISERKASLIQIILGLVAVLTIFIFCNYVFKLYWAITFSICIVYTTSFDRALQNVFPGLETEEE
jgi:DNA-directed RNA polymerase subunit RPC12/RpoP